MFTIDHDELTDPEFIALSKLAWVAGANRRATPTDAGAAA